jgi:flagellar basal body L-ring protein FlgH
MSRYLNLLLLSNLIFFNACSWFSKSKEGPLEYAPRVVNSIPPPKPPKREPGSLWSEDSRWNDIYNPTQGRYPGDVVIIKMNPGLKAKILAMTAPPEREKDKKEDKNKDKDEKEMKEAKKDAGKEEAAPAANAQSSQNDTKSIEATILEVLPRGIYKISANRGVHIGAKDPYVTLMANAREKDITGEETVSSDALFNVQMEIIRPEETTKAKPTATN